jgi:hypothetical protein
LPGGGQYVEHRGDVAGEALAAGGQGDRPVRAGAQQRGAGGVFELADLADLAGGRARSAEGWMWDLTVQDDHDFYVETAAVLRAARAGPTKIRRLAYSRRILMQCNCR